jgi:hypothetical protein
LKQVVCPCFKGIVVVLKTVMYNRIIQKGSQSLTFVCCVFYLS